MTEQKKTRAQIEAAKRTDELAKRVHKALGKKPITLRELAAKLGLAQPDGSVKPSVATKLRGVLASLIESGKAKRDGVQRSSKYAKA